MEKQMNKKVEVQKVLVTPKMAEEWLRTNTENRSVRAATVARYAADMKSGNWYFSNQGIGFDHRGVLIDGQHRLNAIVKAGVAVEMMVARNLETKVRDFVDSGIRRSAADMITFEQGGDTTYNRDLAAIARGMLDGFGSGSDDPTAQEVKDHAVKHRDLILKFVSLQKRVPSGVASAFVNAVVVAGAPADYVAQLASALVELRFDEATEPLRLLAQRLNTIPRKGYTVVNLRYRITVSALRAIFEVRPLKMLTEAQRDWEPGETNAKKRGRKPQVQP